MTCGILHQTLTSPVQAATVLFKVAIPASQLQIENQNSNKMLRSTTQVITRRHSTCCHPYLLHNVSSGEILTSLKRLNASLHNTVVIINLNEKQQIVRKTQHHHPCPFTSTLVSYKAQLKKTRDFKNLTNINQTKVIAQNLCWALDQN